MLSPDSLGTDRSSPGFAYLPPAAVLALAGLFALVAWRSVQHVNTQWDEMTDHRIALALLEHPLWGSGLDGSQARLPMYLTAAAYACFGASLAVARTVSIVVGAATIVMAFSVGRRWFGDVAGMLAAALLAVSPYFIGFSRTAMTEGDAFCPLAVLLVVTAFDAQLRRRDSRRLVIFAAALGLALAVKFYALLLVPALVICDVVDQRVRRATAAERDSHPVVRRGWGALSPLIQWAVFALVLECLAAAAAQLRLVHASIGLWAVGLIVLLLGLRELVPVGRGRRIIVGSAGNLPAVRGWLVILPLAGAIALAICPEHVIQPEVPRALLRRLIRRDHTLPMTAFIDPLRLYSGIILLKLGLPLGVMTAAALVRAWIRSPHEPRLRLLLAVVGLYVLLLTTLPVRQAFYLLAVYPLLILLLSTFIVQAARSLRGRPRLRSAWIALVATSCLYLLWGVIRVYPDFGLYGYEVVGRRWLGAESRGYRNLIQVTNDGTQDALRWCVEHVPPGKRVVSFLWDDHVIDAFVQRQPLCFELVRRLGQADPLQGPPLEDADYLLVSLNNQATYRDMPAAETRADYFEPEPVHVVWRGRGPYRMGLVQIYQRRSAG